MKRARIVAEQTQIVDPEGPRHLGRRKRRAQGVRPRVARVGRAAALHGVWVAGQRVG